MSSIKQEAILLKYDLADLDLIIDRGPRLSRDRNTKELCCQIPSRIRELQSLEKCPKSKIKWAIEGDENSKYYHDILNKKRSQLAIRGILVDADQIIDESSSQHVSKSKLMGIYVDADKVAQAARKIGCVTLKTPFTYLGSKVGGHMSRIQSWNETIEAMASRLSKWKMKTLLIGVGNGSDTLFWEETWHGDVAFKFLFSRAYALESCKNIDVASKLSQNSLAFTFCREPRGGVEQDQFDSLKAMVEGTSLVNIRDRWIWSLQSSRDFTVASIRKLIDEFTLSKDWSRPVNKGRTKAEFDTLISDIANLKPEKLVDSDTCIWSLSHDDKFLVNSVKKHIDELSLPSLSRCIRWCKIIPRKANIFMWRMFLDRLLNRLNLSSGGLDIDSIMCSVCNVSVESSAHTFFSCDTASTVGHPVRVWSGWKIRQNNVKYQMPIEYEKEPALFSIKLHHAGKFKELEKRKYVNGLVAYVDGFDIDKFYVHELNDVMVELGYVNDDPIYYHYMIPGTDLEIGLRALGNDLDVLGLANSVVIEEFPSSSMIPKKGLLLKYHKPSSTPHVTPSPTTTVNPTRTSNTTTIVTPSLTPTCNLSPIVTPSHSPNTTLSPSKRKFTKNSTNKRKTNVNDIEPVPLLANVNVQDPEPLPANAKGL
ncbi:RNA-directed DNA polymerase, eukaryota [Tanacetum coccineum]|uniref:RNA-directed DNA polymerase, eukaryota n=1 Tax=Tanacetum coccineum TaxID=301880 RepID=A0ABQ4X490_9ASTR